MNSYAQARYTWIGNGNNQGARFYNSANWSPARVTALETDILVFDGSQSNGLCIVDFGTGSAPLTQRIGGLEFINGTSARISGPTNANNPTQLTVGLALPVPTNLPASTGREMLVDRTSSVTVTFGGATQNRFLEIVLADGRQASIAGNITFNTTAIPSRLVGTSVASINFTSTGSFTATDLAGSPFGTTGANSLPSSNGTSFSDVTVAQSVIFPSGALYTQSGGNDPFGNTTSSSPVAVFQNGSRYVFAGGTFSPIGQTYGNLEFTSGTATTGGSQTLTVANDLTMTGGVFNDNVTGGSTGTGTVLQGNLLANSGTLNFSPNGAAGRVGFNGFALQTISGGGTLNFDINAHMQVTNAVGLTLQRNVQVNGLLILTSGLINTASSTLLTLGNGVGAQGGSSASYVNGPVAHVTAAGTNSDVIFPVGKSGNYRPLFLNTTGQSAAATYVGEQIESAPTRTLTAPLTRVSFRRYFQLAPTTTVSLTQATVTITFDTDDFANYPADPTFVMAVRNAANVWASIGRSGATGNATNGAPVSGTLTSAAFTSFPPTTSGFSLASTSTATGYPGANPLPVELTKFAATTKASGIALDWATASEKNSQAFEVQRSANGESFETVLKVAAQGNSAVARAYAALDRAPLPGLSHYRLRQVDADGTSTYSPVVTARWATSGEAAAYPNPTAGTLYFGQLAEGAPFRVLNGQGRALLSGQTSAAGLDVKALPAGIYLLEIVTGSGRSVQRFVRE